MIANDISFADIKIRLRLRMRHVAVRRIAIRARGVPGFVALPVLLVKAVHPAVHTANATRAVAGLKELGRFVVDIPGRCKADRLQCDLVAGAVIAVLRCGRAGKSVEKIVEGAVLLNDDHDVLNFAAGSMAMQLFERRLLLRLRKRRRIEPVAP